MPTLARLRERVYAQPGMFRLSGRAGVETTIGAAYTGTAAADGYQSRRIVSSDLGDIPYQAIQDTGRDMFDGAYVFLPSTRDQRRVAHQSYVPENAASDVATTGTTQNVGHITVGRAFSATVAANATFEILAPVPAVRADGMDGVHDHINRALRTQYRLDRLSMLGVSNQYRYSMAMYPWLTRESQLIAVRDRETTAGLEPAIIDGGGRLRLDAHGVYLQLITPVPTGTTFYLDVRRPLSSWIKSNNTWQDSTSGLVAEADECIGDEDELALLAYYFVAKALSARPVGGTSQEWSMRQAHAAAMLGPELMRQALDVDQSHRGESTASMSFDGTSGRGRLWP